MKMYTWICKSNDGYEQEATGFSDTKKEAYENMRDAALEKIKWNTEFDEDFEDGMIDYHIDFLFSQWKIIHKSYSGVYTYVIKEVDL